MSSATCLTVLNRTVQMTQPYLGRSSPAWSGFVVAQVLLQQDAGASPRRSAPKSRRAWEGWSRRARWRRA